ncbi:vacuolar protein sorting-associated protein 37D isoform 1-T1 [Ciconia maguari]
MSRPPAPPGSPRRFGALSTAQLRALLQDEPRLQRAARLSRKFQSLQLDREMCLASNCTLARVNLSLRPRLEDGKASLAIKYQELREIREACWDKQQRLEAYLENWSLQSALGQLQAKLSASEAESEVSQAQIEQFLAQDLPLDSFLESFCQSRTRSHICRMQLEKLQELLQKDQLRLPDTIFQPWDTSQHLPALKSPARTHPCTSSDTAPWSAPSPSAGSSGHDTGSRSLHMGSRAGTGDGPAPGPVPPRGLRSNTLAGEHVGVGAWCRHSSKGLWCLLGRHRGGCSQGDRCAWLGVGWGGCRGRAVGPAHGELPAWGRSLHPQQEEQ